MLKAASRDANLMHVYTFDRDKTVDVNRGVVPLEWIEHLAHETPHEVWAHGNQRLTWEADIPGAEEAIERARAHSELAAEWGDVRSIRRVTRLERIRLVGRLFPDADGYVAVDDRDISSLIEDGWEVYRPAEFVETHTDAFDWPVQVD